MGLRPCRGCRTVQEAIRKNWKDLGRSTIEGESPVQVKEYGGSKILSRGGPEEPPLKQAAPSAKAKYELETDSEVVP